MEDVQTLIQIVVYVSACGVLFMFIPWLFRILRAPQNAADLRKAVMRQLKAGRSDLVNAIISGYFRRNKQQQVFVDLYGIGISPKTDLTCLYLPAGTSLSAIIAEGATLNYACLAMVNLERAVFANSHAVGLNASHARLCGAILNDVYWSKAVLDRANLADAHLNRAELFDASLVGAILTDAAMCGAKFFGAKMFSARLIGAQGDFADFSGADLKMASFINGAFPHAVFEGANLEGADFRSCDLTGAVLSRACLLDVKFNDDTQLTGVSITDARCVPQALVDRIERELPKKVQVASIDPSSVPPQEPPPSPAGSAPEDPSPPPSSSASESASAA